MTLSAFWIASVVLLGGCGGAASASADLPDSGDANALDASDLPSEFVMSCPTDGGPVAIKLPCLLGYNLAGGQTAPGVHALECSLRDSPAGAAFALIIPLARLPMLLNQPLRIPSDDIAVPPGYPLGLSGTATFFSVDPAARRFVGRLLDAKILFESTEPDAEACTVINESFWAAPGAFL